MRTGDGGADVESMVTIDRGIKVKKKTKSRSIARDRSMIARVNDQVVVVRLVNDQI